MSNIVLDPHQSKAADFVIKHKKAALFMGVGTGKTYTALEIYRRVQPKVCLIITTAKLIREKQWHEEIVEYLGEIPDNIILMSHQKFVRSYKKIFTKTFDMIIFDEAHKIKSNAKTRGKNKTSRLMKLLARRAEYVVPMTGTPVGKDFIDIFNIFRNCDINMWYDWTEEDFIKAYYYHFYKDWIGAGFKVIMATDLKPQYKDILWGLVREKAIVVKTEEVLDLKKQKFKVLRVDGPKDDKMYKLIEKKILRYEGYETTLITIKRHLFKHQAANGFIYEEGYDKTVRPLNRFKIDRFEQKIPAILKKLKKLVVVYWFKEDKRRLMESIEKLGYKHTTSKKEFKKDADIFLLNFYDSEGLNLQKIARGMFFYSYQPSYMNFSQITGRIWRRGQQGKCYYFIMIAKGTIEEDMWTNIKHKKEKDDFIKNELKNKEDDY